MNKIGSAVVGHLRILDLVECGQHLTAIEYRPIVKADELTERCISGGVRSRPTTIAEKRLGQPGSILLGHRRENQKGAMAYNRLSSLARATAETRCPTPNLS